MPCAPCLLPPPPRPHLCTSRFQGASASKAERNWKIYGRIKTPARAAMSHEKADKRVFLYNVLQGKLRTEKSNWTPPLIEWVDASSEEEEAAAEQAEPEVQA